jgi:hypothetical protein
MALEIMKAQPSPTALEVTSSTFCKVFIVGLENEFEKTSVATVMTDAFRKN